MPARRRSAVPAGLSRCPGTPRPPAHPGRPGSPPPPGGLLRRGSPLRLGRLLRPGSPLRRGSSLRLGRMPWLGGPRRGWLRAGVVLGLLGLAATGCATRDGATPVAAGATAVTVEITEAGCAPQPATVPAGPVTFRITNKDAGAVTEAELKSGETILGEKENLTPGLSGQFTLNLKAGSYALVCPNAKQESWDFTVTGAAPTASRDPGLSAALDQAVAGYRDFVIAEVAKLVPATRQFTDAVRAGDVARAKQLYPKARYFYEEIEPVAESFGDLDPQIDARADDVEDPAAWTGFHRIEKALWQDGSTSGLTPVAAKLDADVAKLRDLVATATYQPAQLANGATELLNEVGASKITGEEDRYSHTDLADFQANVDGAKKAFDLLVPALRGTDPDLATTIAARFTEVSQALAPYRRGDGFVDYSTVDDAGRRVLTQRVDALAEPLSQVAAKVAG
jgi:iron uptake system component EfeO